MVVILGIPRRSNNDGVRGGGGGGAGRVAGISSTTIWILIGLPGVQVSEM